MIILRIRFDANYDAIDIDVQYLNYHVVPSLTVAF